MPLPSYGPTSQSDPFHLKVTPFSPSATDEALTTSCNLSGSAPSPFTSLAWPIEALAVISTGQGRGGENDQRVSSSLQVMSRVRMYYYTVAGLPPRRPTPSSLQAESEVDTVRVGRTRAF